MQYYQSTVTFLGHVISEQDAFFQASLSQNHFAKTPQQEASYVVSRALWLCRSFVPNFSVIEKPLYAILFTGLT